LKLTPLAAAASSMRSMGNETWRARWCGALLQRPARAVGAPSLRNPSGSPKHVASAAVAQDVDGTDSRRSPGPAAQLLVLGSWLGWALVFLAT
jgi:hypothetical protein